MLARQYVSTCARLLAALFLGLVAFNLSARDYTFLEVEKMSIAQKKGLYKWVTGEKFTYDGWSGGPPAVAVQFGSNGFGRSLEQCYYGLLLGGASPASWVDTFEDEFTEPYFGLIETPVTPAVSASSLKWIQWAKADGGNNHWYALSQESGTWKEAETAAKKQGLRAHLVTITSMDEALFVAKNFANNDVWIGLSRIGIDPRPGPHIHRINLRGPFSKCDICGSGINTPTQARADLRVPTAR